MSTGINHTAPGTPAFRDEIFQWPIARMDNVYIWMTLFEEYLTSPLDKKNLYLASPQFFGPFLVEEKCSFFLGEVLHILHKNNYLDLTNTEFLEFRTLSNLCKISIDKCLQMDNPCFQNLDGIDHDHGRNQGSNYGDNDLHNPQLYTCCWMSSLLKGERRVQKRIQEYALMIRSGTIAPPQGALPFPYTTLSFVRPESTAALRQSEQDIRLVLSTLGTKIHHFIYHLFHLSDSPFSIVELLRQLLGLMPNLRTLMIHYSFTFDHWDEPDVPRGASSPFPNLDHLEVLKAKNAPIKILKPLIDKYGSRLKKISVYQLENDFSYDGIFSPAMNLMELSLPRISTDSMVGQYLRDNIKQTGTLRCISVTVGIQSVESSGDGIFQGVTCALREIFEKGKLHTLNLFVEGCYKNENFYASDIRLKIPTLRRLWIQSVHTQMSYIDFILGVSDSLEELVLIMGYQKNWPADRRQSEIIQFSGCWNKMEESNVWKLMPKLQKITIRCLILVERFYWAENVSIRPSNIS